MIQVSSQFIIFRFSLLLFPQPVASKTLRGPVSRSGVCSAPPFSPALPAVASSCVPRGSLGSDRGNPPPGRGRCKDGFRYTCRSWAPFQNCFLFRKVPSPQKAVEQDLTELSQHLPQEPDQAVTRGGRGVGQHLPQEADQAVTQEGGGGW